MRLRYALAIVPAFMLSSGLVNAQSLSFEPTRGSDGLRVVAETEPKTEPSPSGDVQERTVPIAPLGGTLAPPPTQVNPVGFGCSVTTHTCSCHGSASSIDCTMMKRVACGGELYACPTTADPARLCCKAVR